MKNLAFVSNNRGMTVDALGTQLSRLGYNFVYMGSDLMEMQNSRMNFDAVIFHATDLLIFTATASMFVREKIEHSAIPCFAIGNAPDLEALNNSFSRLNMLKEFKRPIDVKIVASDIHYYLSTYIETKRHKVLVVDDSGQMLRSVKEWLEGRYSVKLANSGLDAIRQITESKPELILLDYDMPVCNGPQVLEMLQKDPQMSDIPVIFLTGNDDPDDVRKAVSLNPAGYVLKSQGSAEIVGKVDSFFTKLDSK